MLNTSSTPSLADIAAVTNNNDTFGGNNGWWVLIILFALFGGWGGGYMGGGSIGANNNYVLGSDFATIQRQLSDGFGATESKLDSISNGICSLGYDQLNQMNGINTNIANLGYQLQQCCCDNKQAIAQVRYDMATGNNAVTTAINQAAQQIMQNDNANYRQLHDENVALQMANKDDKIAELTAQVQALNLAASQCAQNNVIISSLRPTPIPSYTVANPFTGAYGYGACGYCS